MTHPSDMPVDGGSSPQQADYGCAESPVLVPSGLRGYRHFAVAAPDFTSYAPPRPRLTPVNHPRGPAIGHHTAKTLEYDPEQRVHEAVCNNMTYAADMKDSDLFTFVLRGTPLRVRRPVWLAPDPMLSSVTPVVGSTWVSFTGGSSIQKPWKIRVGDFRALHETGAPVLECRCGFYASYDPATNFWAGTHPLMRAVVELSGRTVMGVRGVRAQRLEIKALAWDTSSDSVSVLHMRRDMGLNGGLGQVFDMPMLKSFATTYDVPYFLTSQDMHDAFPPDDVSGLLREGGGTGGQ